MSNKPQKYTGFSVLKATSHGKNDGRKEYTADIYCNGKHARFHSSDKDRCNARANATVSWINNLLISDGLTLDEAFNIAVAKVKSSKDAYKEIVLQLPIADTQLNLNFDKRTVNEKAEVLKAIPITLAQYTYIIRNDNNGECKIGRSNNLYYSYIHLSSACYTPLMYCDKDIKGILHNVFKDKRVRCDDEWFQLEQSDLKRLHDVYGFKYIL